MTKLISCVWLLVWERDRTGTKTIFISDRKISIPVQNVQIYNVCKVRAHINMQLFRASLPHCSSYRRRISFSAFASTLTLVRVYFARDLYYRYRLPARAHRQLDPQWMNVVFCDAFFSVCATSCVVLRPDRRCLTFARREYTLQFACNCENAALCVTCRCYAITLCSVARECAARRAKI